MENSSANFELLASFFLPNGILDWFDFIKASEELIDKPKTGSIHKSTLHVYLDEKDNRTEELSYLRPNGFTEETLVKDFPARNRNLILHMRRRRWKDEQGKNVILNVYPTTVEGTRYSEELAAFLKGADGLDSEYRPIIRALFYD